MIQNKRVLLIAGGGTLGTYVSEELLRLGAEVEVICPEEKTSNNDRLIFHQSLATEELLRDLFSKKHYDGIVNFIHYEDAEAYKKIYPLLIAKAEKKGRTRAEVDEITSWLTGYTSEQIESCLSTDLTYGDFFRNAPSPNPKRMLITGVVCGVRVENVEEDLMREMRYLDKLIDELAKGKAIEKILRK